MKLSLKPDHLKRYGEILRLLQKHGGADVVRAARKAQDGFVGDEFLEADLGNPDDLVVELERMGPTFIKLGQVLASRPDLVPQPYLEPLSRLQDNVSPFSFDQVQEIVSDELGVRLSKAFESFDEKPVAAASLGQVHRGKLRNGREVAVKVQRPHIRQTIRKDFEALDELARFADAHTSAGRQFAFHDLLEEFRRTLVRELDYRQEAQHLRLLSEKLKEYRHIVIPQPVDDYTTARVLTMDFVPGTNIRSLNPVVRLELDGATLADELSRAYLDQILIHGVVHADPHPGNVFITPDHRIALIDLGMVVHLRPELQEHLLKLLLALTEGRSDEAAELSIDLGKQLDEFDRERFRRSVSDLVSGLQAAPLSDVQVGRVMMELARISGANGLRPSPELAMLGKTLFNLDEVARLLDPDIDPNEIIRSHSSSLLQRRMLRSLSPGNVVSGVLEFNELIQKLPGHVNRFLNATADGRLELNVKTMDETRVLEHLQKLGNRIALGLVLAALILGAAMLVQVETASTILGYPGLAIILFLAAVGLGFTLVVRVMVDSARLRRRGHR